MDEAQLEDKLKELVKEFGGAADSQYKKLAMLTQQTGENQKKLEKPPEKEQGQDRQPDRPKQPLHGSTIDRK